MESDELDDLYRDAILDHNRNPRNRQPLDHPDGSAHAVNPFCGDEVELQLATAGGRITNVGVQAIGCSINKATASMLSEAINGASIEDIAGLAHLFRETMTNSDRSGDDADRLGELTALAGVRKFPVRIKCALLAWDALEDALGEVGGPSTSSG